jgi:hypothetical protein
VLGIYEEHEESLCNNKNANAAQLNLVVAVVVVVVVVRRWQEMTRDDQ